MSLRLAPQTTKKIPIGDEDWIEVRTDISRKQFNQLLTVLPEDYDSESKVTLSTASAFTGGLFSAFVVGWSVVDDIGEPVEPTLENYDALSRQSAQLIDSAIADHFNELTPDEVTATKSEGTGKSGRSR